MRCLMVYCGRTGDHVQANAGTRLGMGYLCIPRLRVRGPGNLPTYHVFNTADNHERGTS